MSFKSKLALSLFVFMFVMGISLPILVGHIQKEVISLYEEKSSDEQGQIFGSYMQAYVDSLAARAATWLSTSAIAPLNQEEPDYRAFESNLLGFGNSISSSHAVKRIHVYDTDGNLHLDYSTTKSSATFTKSSDELQKVILETYDSEGRVARQILADDGTPHLLLSLPSEDEDEEINFVHLYLMGLGPLLSQFVEASRYPTLFLTEAKKVYPSTDAELTRKLAEYKSNLIEDEGRSWRKRRIRLNHKLVTAESHLEVYADLTELNAQFERISLVANVGLIAICVGFFLTFLAILSHLMKPLGNVVLDLSSISHDVGEKSQSVMSSTEDALKNVESQLNAVSTTSSAADEINAMLQRTRELGQQTLEFSEESKVSAERGLKSMHSMVDGIERLEKANRGMFQTVLDGNQEISDLIKIVEEIAEKTEVINAITFQTKMLSFNASVEAARAGEHGKGFAVVAEEVGSLARMSGEAAKEINEIVSRSISLVNETLSKIKTESQRAIEHSREEIQRVTEVEGECTSVLQSVAENFTKVDARINELSSAIDEQTLAVHSITDAMKDIQVTAESNQMSSRKNYSAATELYDEAQVITNSVLNLKMMFRGRKSETKKAA